MIKLGGIVELGALGKPGQVIPNPYARAFSPVKEEETIKEQDHEVSMAQSSLDSIIEAANSLKQNLGEMEKEIPAWIQDHISKAENYITQASDFYHEYESVNEEDCGCGGTAVNEDGKLKGGEDDPCWKGYEMVGMKMKDGKEVPNCVPKNESIKLTKMIKK